MSREFSKAWNGDLRTTDQSERSEAIRIVQEQCRRAGLVFHHRGAGWSVEFPDKERHYWPDGINVLVDNVEAYLTALGGHRE